MKNSSLLKRYNSIDEIGISTDVWHTLAAADRPIVMYGMGNGADKILAVFDRYHIKVADFFASDGFVRHQSFHEKTVMSYSEISKKYEDFIIVVSFGSHLPEVLETIYMLNERHELYVPDVPVVEGGEIFDLSFFDAHRGELSLACKTFADESSRELFCDVIMYKLTGKIDYLKRGTSDVSEVMNRILHSARYEYTADLGAYNGDSIRELANFSPGLKEVTALEPDFRNFKKLSKWAVTSEAKIFAYNCAAWDNISWRTFTAGGNRNSTLTGAEGLKTGAKIKNVAAAPLDSLISGPCDYIKYDVEGAEYEAICGSRNTIMREYPELLVSVYHKSEDLFKLPLLIRELGYGHIYLRRYECIPAWDLNLLAVY